jgi:hypothetical protein
MFGKIALSVAQASELSQAQLAIHAARRFLRRVFPVELRVVW